MITSRDRVIQTLHHEPVDRAPRDLWILPGTGTRFGDEVGEMQFRYPSDVVSPDFRYPRGTRARGAANEPGQYIDAWGCTWQVTDRGTVGQVVDHPLADPDAIGEFRAPVELLEKLAADQVPPAAAAEALPFSSCACRSSS